MSDISFPSAAIPVLLRIQRCANDLGIRTYLVGGYVRDLLLDRPSKDMDFTCLGKGSGVRLARYLAEQVGVRCEVFSRFGTAQLKWEGHVCEFVAARKESYQAHSRNPEVVEASFEEDIARRDFTCNALAYAVNDYPKGTWIDLYEGYADLRRGCLRTPLSAEKTFSDDPLRMMRGARFVAQLGFELEGNAIEAMRASAHRLSIVSVERVREELNALLMGAYPSHGFLAMLETDLLPKVFPELLALKGVERRGKHAHKDNFFHTLQVLDNVARAKGDVWLRWAALLHDIAKPATKSYDVHHGWSFHGHEVVGERMTFRIFSRFRLPKRRASYVAKLVRLHLRPIALVSEHVTDKAVRRLLFEAEEDIDDLMLLCRADITSKNDQRVQRYLSNFDLVDQKLLDLKAKDHLRAFEPPVGGQEIMEMFQLKPSPQVGLLKQAIKDAILAGRIPNERAAAKTLLQQQAAQLGITPSAVINAQKKPPLDKAKQQSE